MRIFLVFCPTDRTGTIMNKRELIDAIEALAVAVQRIDGNVAYKHDVASILFAVEDALRRDKDLSVLARCARTLQVDCPQAEPA